MARVFISYKRADKELVFPLKNKIEAAIGEPCWIDMDGIESDAQFVNVIIRAINECEVFLFMYSHHHAEITDFERDWTIREINLAEKKHKRIVFVNIDQTPLSDYFEMLFGLKQQVDATSPIALNHLLSDIQNWFATKKRTTTSAEQTQHLIPYSKALSYIYNKDRHEAEVFGKLGGNYSQVSIPPYIEKDGIQYKVVKVKGSAFERCKNLTTVIIPDTIEEIGNGAFEECECLKTITIPDSIQSIGDEAFKNCHSLTSIKLPEKLIRISRHTFMNCSNLKDVVIPKSVQSIEIGAFWGCKSLTVITLPSKDPNLGLTAFDPTCKVIRQ